MREAYSGGNYIDAPSHRRGGFVHQRAVRRVLKNRIFGDTIYPGRALAGVTTPTDATDSGRSAALYVSSAHKQGIHLTVGHPGRAKHGLAVPGQELRSQPGGMAHCCLGQS